MYRPSNQFFTDTAFATNQNRGVARGRAANLFVDFENRVARSDDLALHAQLVLELVDLVSGFGKVFNQLLFTESSPKCQGYGFGHRQCELKVF